jgi:hypothetical protein
MFTDDKIQVIVDLPNGRQKNGDIRSSVTALIDMHETDLKDE